jgi:methionyl-tRNA formyltransferase
MEKGAELLIKTLEKIEDNSITRTKQDDSLSTYAPMLSKDTQRINWNESAENIHNLIRGLSPWPASFFSLDDKLVKVYSSDFNCEDTNHEPGYVTKVQKDGIYVACRTGTLIIKEIQMPGKNKVEVEAYLRGNTFPEKVILK